MSHFVLAIAVSMGAIGKLRPQLFLRLPHGWIPWAITGNPLPPFFRDDCWHRENWQPQDGDVVLSTGTKAGTMWVHTIVLLLRSNGWDGFDELRDYFGSCEFMDYPDMSLETRLNQTAWKRAITQAKGFRGFQHFTHKFPGEEPNLFGLDPELNPLVKYIAVARNGKEVLRSWLPFVNSHTERFCKMWGNFIPSSTNPEGVVKFAVDDMPNFYFGHLKAWWQRKHLSNVLLLHYRNLRKAPTGAIRQIASFLEIELTPQLLAQVLHKSSLQYMTHPKRNDKYSVWAGYPHDRFLSTNERSHVRPDGGRLDHSDGIIFTPELTRKWEAAVQTHFGHDPALVEFATTGAMEI